MSTSTDRATRATNATATHNVVRTLTAAGYHVERAPDPRGDLFACAPGGHARRVRVRVAQHNGTYLGYGTQTANADAPTPDAWAVWSPELEAAYLVDHDTAARGNARLRLTVPGNRQVRGIVYADDHRIVGNGDRVSGQTRGFDPGDVAAVCDLAQRYRCGSTSRADTAALQTMLDALVDAGNVPTAAEITGLSVDQVRTLTGSHRQGRTAGYDAAPGRTSHEALSAVVAKVADHPAAHAHRALAKRSPARFLVHVAIDATDGSAPAVDRFLTAAGWERRSRSTVHYHMAKIAEEAADDEAAGCSG